MTCNHKWTAVAPILNYHPDEQWDTKITDEEFDKYLSKNYHNKSDPSFRCLTDLEEDIKYHLDNIWHWCIRCGKLRLGDETFSPGPNQIKDLEADEIITN